MQPMKDYSWKLVIMKMIMMIMMMILPKNPIGSESERCVDRKVLQPMRTAYVTSYITYVLLGLVKLGKLVMWRRGRKIITSTNEQD